MRCVRWHADERRAVADYQYECGCGCVVEISVLCGTDPAAAIAGCAANRGVPPGGRVLNVSVIRRVPRFARGGYMQPFPPGFIGIGQADVEPDPEPEGPGPELRCYEGSFVGYRAWRLSDWQLVGTGGIGTDPWTPGVNEARCALRSHPAPHEDCQCGLYGLARFDDQSAWWRNADVLGAIEAWADAEEGNHDRFFVHATGFRAQYAKIVLLAVEDDWPVAKKAAIRALANEHGADVCKLEHLEAAAGEHGQLMPDELLAWAGEGIYVDFRPSFQAQMGQLAAVLKKSSIDTSKMAEALRAGLLAPARPPAAPTSKGIKRTLRTPGPPGHGKFRDGDRVRDSKGQVWQCVKAGSPGSWEAEAPVV